MKDNKAFCIVLVFGCYFRKNGFIKTKLQVGVWKLFKHKDCPSSQVSLNLLDRTVSKKFIIYFWVAKLFNNPKIKSIVTFAECVPNFLHNFKCRWIGFGSYRCCQEGQDDKLLEIKIVFGSGRFVNHWGNELDIFIREEDIFYVILEVLLLDSAHYFSVHLHVKEREALAHNLILDGVYLLDSLINK